METYATVGAEFLSEVDSPYPAVPTVRQDHHENWDGSRQPDGLKGEEILIVRGILSLDQRPLRRHCIELYRGAPPAAEAFRRSLVML